jgi:hypothetical protein
VRVFPLVGLGGLEPPTSSLSVPGRHGSPGCEPAIGGSHSRPSGPGGWRGCCHFCCHPPPGLPGVTSRPTLCAPQGSWTSGPLASLPRSSGASSGRHGRLTPGVSWRHRQRPREAYEDDRGSREDDPGCCRSADQRGTDHHDQRAGKKEPGPPASPQGPRHARSPAARGPSGRGGGQAQRSWHWGHYWPVIVSPPRPRGHWPSPAASWPYRKAPAESDALPWPGGGEEPPGVVAVRRSQEGAEPRPPTGALGET